MKTTNSTAEGIDIFFWQKMTMPVPLWLNMNINKDIFKS